MSYQQIRAFVDLLWPPTATLPAEAHFSIWEMPGKRSYHFKVRDPNLEIAAGALDSQGHNVFYGVGLRNADLGEWKRGEKSDVLALPGFWADIDLHGNNHKADNLPANLADVITNILAPFDWEPSLVVNSGGGLHVYWLFREPLLITDANRDEVTQMSRAFQERLALLAVKQGWKWDSTADLPRVLRPAGTHNRKRPESAPLVEIMGPQNREVTRYDYALIRGALRTKEGTIASILGRETDPPPERAPSAPLVLPRPVDTRTEEEVLEQLWDKIRRNRRVERAELLAKIKKGEPLAGPGARDNTLQKVCSWLAFYDSVADPEILVQVLSKSLEAMAAEHPEDALTEDDAIEKIARAQADARRKAAASAAVDDKIKAALIASARAMGSKPAPPKPPLTAVPSPLSQAKPTPSPDPLQLLKADAKADAPAPAAPKPKEPRSSGHEAGEPGAAAQVAAATKPVLTLVEQLRSVGPREGDDAYHVPPEPEGKYSWDEIAGFRKRQEQLSGRPIPEERWKKRWVVQHGEALWVFVNGRYLSPIPKSNFRVSSQRDLWWILPEHDLEGHYYWSPQAPRGDGTMRFKNPDEILDELATTARKVIADLTIPESYYRDDNETFYEAVSPLRRDITSQYDEHIDTWLRKLAGPEYAEKLLDWVATVTRLEAPSCALVLSGPPNIGKSLLANGLARLWHPGGYTRMEDVIGAFNADVASCPLVVADEAIPDGPNGKPISTKKLRDLISADTRQLKRKFMANVPLRGTIRCMFLANSERLLDLGDETLGPDSLAAVASRFLHIAADEEASGYIESLGGRHGGTWDWVDGDRIARHALWLKENRPVAADGRFWVQGRDSKMLASLATSSYVNGQVVEWIVRHLMRPDKQIIAVKGVLAGKGSLWVNTNIIGEYFAVYLKNAKNVPALRKITEAVKGLSNAKDSMRINAGKLRGRYWPVRPEIIYGWAHENGVGDVEKLQEAINNQNVEAFEFMPSEKEIFKGAGTTKQGDPAVKLH